MNRSEVGTLIQMIERLSGTTWPAGAADAWLPLLLNTHAVDGLQAVQEWYDQAEPASTRITPGYVRRRATAIHDLRTRVRRQAIEAKREPSGVPPNAEARRIRAQLIERFGDNSGILSRRGRTRAAA